MKYYKLISSRDRKEVGKKPQSQTGNFGDIQQNFLPWEGKIDIDFKLPEPFLEKKAKQVSFLDVAFMRPWFLVIDDNLLSLLKDYNIGNYQEWKINAWQDKKLIEKYNLFLLNDTKQTKYIEFKNSEFYSKKLGDWNNSSVQKTVFVDNYDEYYKKKEELRKDKLMLQHRKVSLNLSNATEDMFRIVNVPSGGYFVSEKLKNAIEKSGFTGLEFTEVSELDKVEVIY